MRPYNVIDTLEAISDVEIARQITFVDYQIYNCIKVVNETNTITSFDHKLVNEYLISYF
jgi:hypothetical protein